MTSTKARTLLKSQRPEINNIMVVFRLIFTTRNLYFPGRNINNLRYTDDTILMAESEEELKEPLDESERGE